MFTNLFINYDKKINLCNINIESLKHLNEIIECKFELERNNYFIIVIKLIKDIKQIKSNDVEIVKKRKGGVLFFAGQIASIIAVIAVLVILMKPLIDIVKMVVMIIKIIGQILALFPQIIETILLVFNPKKFIDDIIFGVSYTIKLVIGGMMDSMDTGTSSNKEENPDDVPKVCMPPSVLNLIFLVICPPLALMINGLKGIFLTVLCALLTVWCYTAGLIFAALHII